MIKIIFLMILSSLVYADVGEQTHTCECTVDERPVKILPSSDEHQPKPDEKSE